MKLFKTGSRSSSKLLHDGSRSYLEEESIIKPEKKNEVHQPLISIHSPLKKNDALSDIIEASNECSSLNHEEKGHKVHPHIEQIPE